MKKIMFNDQYGLTQAVLDGRKTQTRRLAYQGIFKRYCNCGFCMTGTDRGKLFINDGNEVVAKSHYKKGEIVAVAQRYCDIPQVSSWMEDHPGWGNKMFVKAEAMPQRIKITRIWVEHLQYISEENCMKEGIFCSHITGVADAFSYNAIDDRKLKKRWFYSPILAYKELIGKLYNEQTWQSNPLVFVYDFELVK